jgi:hypothetical protein
MSLNFGKRGNIQELAFIIVVIFVLGITIFFAVKVQRALNDKIQAMTDIPAPAKQASATVTNITPNMFDKLFIVAIFVFYIGALISAWYIDISPVFFVLSVIILLVLLAAGAMVNNVNEEIINRSEFASFSSEFPIIVFFSHHMFQIITAMGILLLAALYAKSRSMTN